MTTICPSTEASIHAAAREPFRNGNNTLFSAEWRRLYVVYSYGEHWPLFIYDRDMGVWFENETSSTVTTNKHRSQARPHNVNPVKLTCAEMKRLVAAGSYAAWRPTPPESEPEPEPQAYLHFGGAGTVGYPFSPRQTVRVPMKTTGTPRSERSDTGYGAKLPTQYMVKWEGRWRRVYVCNFGNAGTPYIGKPGAWLATVDTAQ